MGGSDLKLADSAEGSSQSPPSVPAPESSPPATDAVAGPLPAPEASKGDWLSSVAHFAIIASVATYGVGFIVAVPYYLRRTVPLRALSHDTYLSAGILFWTLTVAAYAVGITIGTEFTKRPPVSTNPDGRSGPLGAFWWVLGVGGFALHLASFSAGLQGMGYVVFTVFLVAFAHAMRSPTRGSYGMTRVVSRYGGLAVALIGDIYFFSLMVFPFAPVSVGGGAEQRLASLTLPNEAPPKATDSWLKFSCRKFPTPPSVTTPVCRRFFRIYETSDSLFLGIAEWPGLCDFKEKPRFEQSTRRCIQRISNTLLPQFEAEEGEGIGYYGLR
jgi:hypothetical protein